LDAIIRKIQSGRQAKLHVLLPLFVMLGLMVGIFVLDPSMIRMLVFLAIFAALVAFSQKSPVAVLFLLTLYLPFMGLLRRALIPVAGWGSFDPLVLLPHLLIGLMMFAWVHRYYIKREPLERDTRLFRLVKWLLVVQAAEVFNPLQGSILTGIGGILFYMIPLFWMALSRTYLSENHIKRLIGIVFGIGVATAFYGLKQIEAGFFSFEYDWVAIGGYESLMLGPDTIRAFSVFTNAAEYALYLVITIVTAWVFVLKGTMRQRAVSLALLPVLWYALFMESSRTSVVMTLLTMAVLVIVQAKPGKTRWLMTGVAAAFVAVAYIGMTSISAASSDPILSHQVNGLANPMDEEHSTAGLHLQMVMDGIMSGFALPIGRGLGITTLAGAKLNGHALNTEYDVSNMFVSLGLIGGLIYLLICAKVFRLAYHMSQHNGKLGLIIYGTLLSTTGLWLMGGNYSTAAWIWVLIGYLDAANRNHPVNLQS
jgi:hypothetical protein